MNLSTLVHALVNSWLLPTMLSHHSAKLTYRDGTYSCQQETARLVDVGRTGINYCELPLPKRRLIHDAHTVITLLFRKFACRENINICLWAGASQSTKQSPIVVVWSICVIIFDLVAMCVTVFYQHTSCLLCPAVKPTSVLMTGTRIVLMKNCFIFAEV